MDEQDFKQLCAELMFISKGGISMADIEDRLTMKEMLFYHEKFIELYKTELEMLSPAIMLQALFGR